MHAIETTGLSKVYRRFFSFQKIVALENLNLKVPTGSIFGFLGLNGAGKTTTIKMLLGLSYPTSGEGMVLGRPLGDVKTKERLGFLPEEAYFQRHLTATSFLDFCGKTLHMEPALRKKRIEELLKLVSMEEKAHTKLLHFSKGMLQRIGVAQALMNDPDLAILDEPLTGLDPKGRAQLKDIMLNLKRNGKTVFFSSHILSDVQAICDSVAIVNRGHMIYQGKVSDLLGINAYHVKVSNIPAQMVEALEKCSSGLSKEGEHWVFTAKSEDSKNQIIALLQKNNLKEDSIGISYMELEPVFLDMIEKNSRERNLVDKGAEYAS